MAGFDRSRNAFAIVVSGVVSAACGSSSAASDAGSNQPQDIVQIGAFSGFCRWSSADAIASNAEASDGVHGLGPLKIYWNQSPPSGSKAFPEGTIIVKESEQDDAAARVVFAMVKRGGDYNTSGVAAPGWEWWSLSDNGDCTMTQRWRGPFAPGGESYSRSLAGDCNGCHGQVADNDYVWDKALQLAAPR